MFFLPFFQHNAFRVLQKHGNQKTLFKKTNVDDFAKKSFSQSWRGATQLFVAQNKNDLRLDH